MAARSPEARAKHVTSRRRHAQASSEWDASTQPAWPTSEVFAEQIQPLLAGVSTSAIRSRIGVSRWYAGRIREGYSPHPRHWQALAGLVGVRQPQRAFTFERSLGLDRFPRIIITATHIGKPCDSLTRGLLRRRHIVAGVHRYIGKETSRRWEQGDDRSTVDFRSKEYSDGKVVADQELREQIVEIGIRKIARRSGVNRETVALIAKGGQVKPTTLAKVVEFVKAKW